MSTQKLRILSAQDLRRALPIGRAVEAMRTAFVQLSAGRATVPLRAHLPTDGGRGTLLIMPAYLGESRELAVKLLSLNPGNAERGLPLIHALVVLFDDREGRPLALIEGGSLTALRTGAAAGLAADLLARPDAGVAAIFGAGVQARTQLAALCAVRPVRAARVFDPRRAEAERFAFEMSAELDLPVDAAASSAQALAGADLVCTATTSATAVFADAELEPGAHVNAVGAYTPQAREIPGETVARARVVVDERKACLAEAGDLLLPLSEGLIDETHLQVELGEVAAGEEPGRRSPEEITLFKSVGVAIQDAAAAQAAYLAACEQGLGVEVDL